MKILLTGGSSFTGMWFARGLAAAGHEVHATFTRDSHDAYGDDGIRAQRVELIQDDVTPVWSCSFGDDTFLETIATVKPDVLCHHAADVTNYKSPDFDATAAICNNTRNLRRVLAGFGDAGGKRVVLTGSVFEGGEGAGSDGLPHFSPYGLSKAMTAQAFAFYCHEAGLPLGKFVIPNPFGAYEEPRFPNYLMKTWFAGKQAGCNTPAYIRDNIHVELLAAAYTRFVEDDRPGFTKLNPSGYAESQGGFAERFAAAMRPRLGLPCGLDLGEQTDFPEPRIRINTDPTDARGLGVDLDASWDAIADFYRGIYG